MHTPTAKEIRTTRRYAGAMQRRGDLEFDAGRNGARYWFAARDAKAWLQVADGRGQVRRPFRDTRRVAF